MANLFNRLTKRSVNLPYVVIIGDVGAGKSTLVEKITGQVGLSSAADESVTRSSEFYVSSDNSILISDTPGSNPIEEKFEHNIQIAHAMNFKPVSRILIVVKADKRIDKVIDDVRKYAESFIDLSELLGVCVTHMDTISWNQQKFKQLLQQELGLEHVVFSGVNISAIDVLREIKASCGKPVDMDITSENFLKFFKISNNNFKILRCTKREVFEMIKIKNQFFEKFQETPEKLKIDLIFEFQAWITEEIIHTQKRVSDENNFEFYGANMANEAGHIANMTNQLRAVLFDVRTQVLGYQGEHGISDLRKCPGCPQVWAKLEGCDGATTCGNRMSSSFDSRKGVMFTFTFSRNGDRLSIIKTGQRNIEAINPKSGQQAGCGRSINWSTMAPVAVPAEFNVVNEIGTDDIKLLPRNAEQNFEREFNKLMSHIKGNWKNVKSSLGRNFKF